MDGDVGADFGEALLGEAVNGQKILDFAKGAALLAKTHNGFGGDGPDGGESLQLFDRRGIEVEGFFRRRRFFRLGESESRGGQDCRKAQQNSCLEEIQKQIPRPESSGLGMTNGLV